VAFRARGPQFVHRQFAVAVLIELFQSGGGIGDFGFVNHAVVVCIERGDDGRGRRPVSFESGACLSTGAVLARRRAIGRGQAPWRRAGILRGDHPRRGAKRQQGEECFTCAFHVLFPFSTFVFGCAALGFNRVCRARRVAEEVGKPQESRMGKLESQKRAPVPCPVAPPLRGGGGGRGQCA